MTQFRTLTLILLGGAALGILALAVPVTRSVLLCSGIAPFDLVGVYVVTVPGPEHQRYNDEFVRFTHSKGLRTGSRSYKAPDTDGGPWYLYRGATGCDGSAMAWSANTARANEFVVTFHHNSLLGSAGAEAIKADFLKQFQGRYKIEREISWDKRVPIGPADLAVSKDGR